MGDGCVDAGMRWLLSMFNCAAGQKVGAASAETGKGRRDPKTPASAAALRKQTPSFASNIITSIRKRVRTEGFWSGSVRILTSSFTSLSPPWLLPHVNA